MAGRTIKLRPCYGRQDEGVANAGGLKPGMLIQRNSTGNLIPHAVANGYGPRKIVLEDALQGKTVDDAYASGDRVTFLNYSSEGKFNMLCKHGFNYPIGTMLASAGDGTFKPATAGTSVQVFGEIVVAADLTAAGAPVLLEADAI